MRLRYDAVKRAIDLTVSVPLLVLSLPAQALIGAAIRATSGPPVLFRQQRPGRGEVPFELVKFRTMDEAQGDVHSTARVTRIGRVLRSTSLDELPTLWNVVRGDMSLVGPRPLLMSYLDRYTPEQARRHDVRPGITGLAQVSGRNAISWPERLELDVRYVEGRCLRLDVSIMARTIGAVFSRAGVDADSTTTMTEFRGQGAR